MRQFLMPWAFYMKFNQRQKEMTIHLSKDMMMKLELASEMLVLNDEEIKEFVHRYDYRKFDYFSHHQIQGIFDTTLRFRTNHGKEYLRTQAICQKHEYGFSCLLIEDIHLHKMHQSQKEFPRTEPLQIVFEHSDRILLFEANNQIHKIKNHLTQVIQRSSN